MRRISPDGETLTLDIPPAARPVVRAPAIFRGDARFYLDLSRLMSRMHQPAPTGVDRVEMAYATHLPQMLGKTLGFVARHPTGLFGRLDPSDVAFFLEREQAKWTSGRPYGLAASVEPFLRTMPRLSAPAPGGTLILASPSNLHRPARFARMNRTLGTRTVALVHDLIPLTHPEYARPAGTARHHCRLETLKRQTAALVTNSAATAVELAQFWQGERHPAIHASRLGIDVPPLGHRAQRKRPFFICVSTIEPRKNHMLLLQIWRRFAETMPADAIPELLVVGRRGWENEHILKMLERGPLTRPHVRELGPLPEPELHALIRGARALLMPSFAEGFGLPVAEALSLGTPVIASDLPAHHEAGADVPEFLGPLDGEGWAQAILDYTCDSGRRAAQMSRMTKWRAPDWRSHLETVISVAETVTA
jgi:glycosyltransferase involved in cell wall biosynthesis|tara:strand:+ start:66088 stop:67350 length:1263 start_codon:yes stop_codon:yes gene_type:complete